MTTLTANVCSIQLWEVSLERFIESRRLQIQQIITPFNILIATDPEHLSLSHSWWYLE